MAREEKMSARVASIENGAGGHADLESPWLLIRWGINVGVVKRGHGVVVPTQMLGEMHGCIEGDDRRFGMA